MKTILLVLLFAISLFAEESEEIGKHSINQIALKNGRIDSSVLASDGKSFFTIKRNYITQWQLSPFKKLISFQTDMPATTEYSGFKIHITLDNKKLILHAPNKMQLWDIATQSIVKSSNAETMMGTMSKDGFVTLDDSDFIRIWDEKNLELKSTAHLPVKYPGYHEHAINMIAGNNILMIQYFTKTVFVDLSTMKILDDVDYDMSLTQDNLHVLNNALLIKNYGHKYGKEFCFERTLKLLLFDLPYNNTLSYVCLPDEKDTQVKRSLILNKNDLYMARDSAIQESGESGKSYSFYQDENAAILTEGYRKGPFTGFGDFKKFLKMNTKDQKDVPINDATYKKYYDEKLLKDLHYE